MRVRHPRDRTPSQVSVDGQRVPVDDDGTFELPEGTSRNWARRFAEAYDATLEDVLVEESSDDICGAEMSDGSTCERPADKCPYHGDE